MRKFLLILRALGIVAGLVVVLAELLTLGIWLVQAHLLPPLAALAVVAVLMVGAGARAFTWLRYK